MSHYHIRVHGDGIRKGADRVYVVRERRHAEIEAQNERTNGHANVSIDFCDQPCLGELELRHR
jgi:hypothetical protein